jgi:hypothetical protein
MGYRDSWLKNMGDVACHFEDTILAFDKYAPTDPVRMLCHSAAHIWKDLLPAGSVVDGVPQGDKYDVLVGSTNWPWLVIGGLMFIENPSEEMTISLVSGLLRDEDSWLPIEEVSNVQVYPHVLVVEKRHPRVMEYLNVLTGVGDDSDLIAGGAKRLAV